MDFKDSIMTHDPNRHLYRKKQYRLLTRLWRWIRRKPQEYEGGLLLRTFTERER